MSSKKALAAVGRKLPHQEHYDVIAADDFDGLLDAIRSGAEPSYCEPEPEPCDYLPLDEPGYSESLCPWLY